MKQEKAQIALERLGRSVPTSSETVTTAYCAGFFDAEGSVSTSLKVGNKIHMSIRVRQNDPYPLQVFQHIYGGYILESTRTQAGNRTFEWKLQHGSVTAFCNEMAPYVIVKREHLKLAKRLVAIKLTHGGRDPRIKEKLALAVEIKLLNSYARLRAEVADMFAE